MNQTIESIGEAQSNSLEALTGIINWGEIASGKTNLPIQKEILEIYPEIVLNDGLKAVAWIQYLGTWRNVHFRYTQEDEKYQLTEFTDKAVRQVKEHQPNAQIEYSLPDKDISILIGSYVDRALAYLMIGGYHFEPTTKLNIQREGQAIKLMIQRKLQRIDVFNFDLDREFCQFNLLGLANLILYQNNSQLQIRQEGETVIFEFALPVWNEI